MYEALVSFATKIISMFKGQVAEIDDPEIVEDLLAAKYIEAYSPQPSGGGWDAGLDFLFYGEHAENPSVQFAFGSYDALKEKYDAGMLPMIFFNDQLRRSYLYEIEKYWEDEYDPDSLVLYVDRSDGFVQCIIQPDNTISHNIIYSD